MNFDDYKKWLDQMLGSMHEPLRELERVRRMHDDMLRPLQQIELMKPPLHQEFEWYQAQQKQLQQMMRPVLDDINTTKAITAALQIEPALSIVQDYRHLTEQLLVPPDLRAMIQGVHPEYEHMQAMPDEVRQMLAGFTRYAAVAPALPRGDTLELIRKQVAELRDAPADRLSEALANTLRWLMAHAAGLDVKTVSFFLVTIIYPLVLSIYQPEIQDWAHPKSRQVSKRLEQQVVRVVVERVPSAALSNLRFVSADRLTIRAAPRKNSSRVSTLQAADVVFAIRAEKDWTYIEYRFDGGEYRGWVYTRYLKSFPSSD
jgi:hypothetical protein